MTDSPTPGPEQRPLATHDSWSREFDQVQATVQALQGAANLLQGAMEQRQGLRSEMQSAEQSLSVLQQQGTQAATALAQATRQLHRATGEIEQVRAEQSGLVAEFDKMVQSALARRSALVSEIADLERQRDKLAQFTPESPENAWHSADAAPAAAHEPVAAPLAASEPVAPEPPVDHWQPVIAAPPVNAWAPVIAAPPINPWLPIVSRPSPTPATPAPPAYAWAPMVAEPPVTEAPRNPWVPTVLQPVVFDPPVKQWSYTEVAPVAPIVAAELPPAAVVRALKPALRPAPPERQGSRWPSLRFVATGLIALMLMFLAILLTPVTQVFGGMQLLAVLSGSMEPTIHVGGIVAVRPVGIGALQIGDVITFANQNNPDVLITHRIVNLEASAGQTLVTTKGDANDSVDAVTVPATRSLGKVDFALPWLGFLMVWLASPLAKVGILAVSVIGFALPGGKRKAEPELITDVPTVDVAVRVPSPLATPHAKDPVVLQPNRPAPSYAAFEREIERLLPRAS